ncbi:MAG: RIP metalloprotease RseP [Dehalococcoidia bacterium]
MTTLIAFVAIFVPLVVIHELGHFVTAKLTGVRVLEFGIGIPPRIWGFRRGETLYSINAIPLGGFVKMQGEEDPSDPRSLAAKPVAVRAAVLGAGATMNLILAIALFTVVFMVPRTVQVGDVTIEEVAANSPAAIAGLQEGDIIRRVDGRRVENFRDLRYRYQLKLGAKATTQVERDGQLLAFDVKPRFETPEGEGPTGIQVSLANPGEATRSAPFWVAVPRAGRQISEARVIMKNGIESWFVGSRSPQDDALGPIGIAQVTGEVASLGIIPLISLAALLSLNLAIFNILPIPALDGGRLFFLAIEVVRRGKRIPPQKEALVHLTGFALLLLLIVIVTFNDISRIIGGDSPLGG